MQKPFFNPHLFNKFRVLLYVLCADISVASLHLIFGRKYQLFNLDYESNIPTIYQGLKLLTFGYFFVFVWLQLRKAKQKNITVWPVTACMFLYLGIDEIGQLHESFPFHMSQLFPQIEQNIRTYSQSLNYSGSQWVFYFIPFMSIIMMYVGWLHMRLLARVSPWYICSYIASFVLLFSIPVLEIYSSSGVYTRDVYGWLMLVEETNEMIGITLLGWVFMRMYQTIQSKRTIAW